MSSIRIVSIIPYKVLPAKLGGEKGIALFSEYVGEILPLTSISTRANDVSSAKHFNVLNILSDHRIRYANIFLIFTLYKILKKVKATHLLIEHPYYGWLAWAVRLLLPVKWVVHSHNIEFERSRSIGRWWWKALKWYECWVYRKADILFFISEDDRRFALEKLGIAASKSHAITYGVETAGLPADRALCRKQLLEKHQLAPETRILLFNGTLHHHSNYDAVAVIAENINPALEKLGIPYCIFICGKGLPASFNDLQAYSGRNIIHAGFVDDISVYFKATDIFLNPIMSGAGIKTKAVEAIAYNCNVVSTTLGALGIIPEVCEGKLDVVADGDWMAFSSRTAALLAKTTLPDTPASFYQYYYWGAIAEKVNKILTGTENSNA